MEKKSTKRSAEMKESGSSKRPARKQSEYGKQLSEKQKVKELYGLREKQFKRFFSIASKAREGMPGENLLSLLERRIDNVVYRLKLANTRAQARQMVVHGHVHVNGKKIYSPSLLVKVNDIITLDQKSLEKLTFLSQVVDKRLNIGIKVPEWLELDKKDRKGVILRNPVRSDIQIPIEEHLIVELYSK